MKLQRLFEMRPAELAFRSRQQLAKTVDRFVAPLGLSSPECVFDALDGDAVFHSIALQLEKSDPVIMAAKLQQRFEHIAPFRFFAGTSETGIAAHIASHCHEARQQIIENANAICRDEFEILGYGKLSFGSPVNWQFDAVSGRKITPAHGSRIKYLANEQVGDSKVVWELNRHQWLLDLGQAYQFTGDALYAEAFVRLVRHWMSQNPPGFGMNWTSSLEVAMRMISWCWALLLFRGSAAFAPELFLQMLGWIQAHARYVERNLSRYFSPNTHLTGEALGLFYVGALLPELKGARQWKALGREILLAELDRQVHPDGVYFEQSTRYQYYTVEMYLHFIILSERNGVAVPKSVKTRLARMLDFLIQVRRPDGTVPQIGDADGGWLLPLVRREPGDYRGLFATAAVLLNNSQFAWAAGDMAAETWWLLGWGTFEGNPQADLLMKPERSIPASVALRCFPEGGYVIMRNGWDEHAHHLIFDTGPLGCGLSGGHGHADLLSVQCSAWGENFLVDAGTFCYTADAAWRRYFRSSQAHNTVLVDGRGQAEPNGPFSWHGKPSARLLSCTSKPGFCLAEAEHEAWGSPADPLVHRRRVLFVDSRYWLIIDDLSGQADHRIDLRYQFAAMPVGIQEDGWVRAHGNRSALLLKAFSNVPLATTVAKGQLVPLGGWISPNYGHRVPAPAVTFSAEAALPLRIVTLLFPLANSAAAAPLLTPIIEDGSLTGVTFASGKRETIYIGDHEISIEPKN